MELLLPDLDATTRCLMLEELSRDVSDGRAPSSPRLREGAHAAFLDLLESALSICGAEELAAELVVEELLLTHEVRVRTAQSVVVRVPVDAALVLARAMFQRYHARAICRRALSYGIGSVVVCVSGDAVVVDPSAETLLGVWMGAQALLTDLRRDRPRLGVTVGAGRGLTVRLVRWGDTPEMPTSPLAVVSETMEPRDVREREVA
jgi:hypothetical protein